MLRRLKKKSRQPRLPRRLRIWKLEEKFGGPEAVPIGTRIFSTKFVQTGAFYEIRGFFDPSTKKRTAKQVGKWLLLPLRASTMARVKIRCQRRGAPTTESAWVCTRFESETMLLVKSSVNPTPGVHSLTRELRNPCIPYVCEAAISEMHALKQWTPEVLCEKLFEFAKDNVTTWEMLRESRVSNPASKVYKDESCPDSIRKACQDALKSWKSIYYLGKPAGKS